MPRCSTHPGEERLVTLLDFLGPNTSTEFACFGLRGMLPASVFGVMAVPLCCMCKVNLPSPQRRRTLDFAKDRDAEVSKSLTKFLEVFVMDTPQDGRHYLCKHCFARLDKARRGLEALELSINTLREEIQGAPSPVHLLPFEVTASPHQSPTPEDSGARGELITAVSTPTRASRGRRRTQTSPASRPRRRSILPSQTSPTIKVPIL